MTSYEDTRPFRRDRACVIAGLAMGATAGALAATLAPSNIATLTFTAAAIGALAGRLIAFGISADEWDPEARRPYVGANSPDADISR